MSLLEQNTTRKGWVDENTIKLDVRDDNEEYKVETSWDITVYAKELESGNLLGFYYLIS